MTKSLVSLLVLAALALSGCAPQASTAPVDPAKIQVIAVESFLADLTQQVAGERAQVRMLIPVGLDPHAFAPAPADVARIAEAQVLVVNGAGLEEWLQETLDNAGGERLVIEASAGLQSREPQEGEHAEMSAQEQADALCLQLAEAQAEETIAAGGSAETASELHAHVEGSAAAEEHAHEHGAELLSLSLQPQEADFWGGFVLLDVEEAGDILIAAPAGRIDVLDASGNVMEVESELPLACAGLEQGLVLELQPGEYTLALNSFTFQTIPFLAGPLAIGHHHHEGDPHFWLDPVLVMRYVENIRDGLIQADPDGAQVYQANAAAYIAELQELDAWIESQVAQIAPEKRLIVTNHESFGYYADRYGFRVVGTIIPSVSTGSAPSAQQLARLIDDIRANGVSVIFLETGANPKLAEQVAAETGVTVVSGLLTHSLTDASGPAPSYIDMMRYNTSRIVDALK